MQKVSKKHQTNESIASEQEATFALANKKSDHFMPGTFILWEGKRLEVLGSMGEVMFVLDGNHVRTLLPYALSQNARRDVAPSQLNW